MMRILQLAFGRVPPDDPTTWHKWGTVLPVRLIDGRLSRYQGQLWRRQAGDRWEYQQDDETEGEWGDRQF